MKRLLTSTSPGPLVHSSEERDAGTLRAFAWLALVSLLAGVLLFPARVHPDLSPIPTLSIFDNVIAFGLLFYAWAIVLFAILLTMHENSKVGFEALLLSVVFSIGFVGFWVVVSGGQPGGDSAINAAILREIVDLGKLGDLRDPIANANLTYFDFPGLFLVAAALRDILSLDVFTAVKLTTLVEIGLLAVLYYVVAWTYLRNQRWATLAAIWAVEGNRQSGFWPSFFPGNFGVFFLMIAVLLLLRAAKDGVLLRPRDQFLLLLVLVGAILAHAGIPAVLLGILGAVFVARGDKATGLVNSTTLLLALVLLLIWQFYGAVRTAGPNILRAFAALLNPGDFLRYFRIVAGANLGQVTPPWVVNLNLFWAVATVGVGGLIALWRLFKIRSQPDGNRTIVATLVGITAVSLLFSFLTGGQETVYRIFLYGSLFTVLSTCSVIILQERKTQCHLQGVVVLALLVLVLPTFLVVNRGVVSMRSFPSENRTGEFIRASYPRGNNLRVFVHISTGINLTYYLPGASYTAEPEIARQSGPKAWLDGQETVLKGFREEAARQKASLYVRYDDRLLMYYGNYFGVKTVKGPYALLMSELEASSNMVYSTGETAIYTNPLLSVGM
jgi:hypothetical protein